MASGSKTARLLIPCTWTTGTWYLHHWTQSKSQASQNWGICCSCLDAAAVGEDVWAGRYSGLDHGTHGEKHFSEESGHCIHFAVHVASPFQDLVLLAFGFSACVSADSCCALRCSSHQLLMGLNVYIEACDPRAKRRCEWL